MTPHEDNPKSIKFHVKNYIRENAKFLSGKKVVDMPAGNGITCRMLRDAGAIPMPFDLFPEYFNIEELECKRANVLEGIPLGDKSVDVIICQEGIEHFTDQFKALTEFNRILRPGGKLIITTPNYSNMRARMSYFLSESERFNSIMPPNEIDSIWMNKQDISNEIYFGHIFLIGAQKLRVLGKLSGFRIQHIRFTRLKSTAFFIFIFTYPFIYLSNWYTYRKHLRKNKGYDREFQSATYKEVFDLSVNPRVLLDSHLFVEFIKEKETAEVMQGLKSVHKEFGTT